jgi:hypothetical protein
MLCEEHVLKGHHAPGVDAQARAEVLGSWGHKAVRCRALALNQALADSL